MADGPEISVVIPTRDRESRLAFALEALAHQELEAGRYEVLVVRAEGAAPPLAAAPAGLTVRFLAHRGRPGPGAQRNTGWRAARAPLVAFTDDDCRPARDWLARLLAAADGTGTIVQGRTEPDPDERHLLYGLARTNEVRGPSAEFETCNIAYPRPLLESLGGFDEEIAGSWTEDTDLGLRASAAGAERVYADGALVWHAVVPRTIGRALRETGRYRWLVRLLARHPDYRRRRFPHRVLEPSHAALVAGLAGAAVLRRRREARLAPLAPYVGAHLANHLRTNPKTPRSVARFALHLPARAAVELAEVAVTLRAAVRHRVLVI